MKRVVVTGAFVVGPLAPAAPLGPIEWLGARVNRAPKIARMDRFCALALAAVDGALRSAALDPFAEGDWNGERTAISLGSAYGCHATNEDYYRGYLREGLKGASPRLFAYTLPSSPAGEISIHYDARGPIGTIASGITSGIDAIAEAAAHVAHDRAERAIVVAVDTATPLLGELLGKNHVLHDAAVALVLESTDVAAARGQAPLAQIAAVSSHYVRARPHAAIAQAVRDVVERADHAAAAIEQVIGAANDVEATRTTGVSASTRLTAINCLAATALVDLIAVLGERSTLIVTSDPEGLGAAALFV